MSNDTNKHPADWEALGNLSLAMDEWWWSDDALRIVLDLMGDIEDENAKIAIHVVFAYVIGLVRRMGYAYMGTADFAKHANPEIAGHISKDAAEIQEKADAVMDAWPDRGEAVPLLRALIGRSLEMLDRDCHFLHKMYNAELEAAKRRGGPKVPSRPDA